MPGPIFTLNKKNDSNKWSLEDFEIKGETKIYDNELIDWKCTKNRNYSNDLLQCLIYTGLARDGNNGYTIDKCSVYYLVYGTYASIDVKQLNEESFMDKYNL